MLNLFKRLIEKRPNGNQFIIYGDLTGWPSCSNWLIPGLYYADFN